MTKALTKVEKSNIKPFIHKNTAQFPFKKSKKDFLISPESLKKQKLMFNKRVFGALKFYFEITYKRSNIFFTFFCKAEKFPNRVFVIYKQSTGLLSRQPGKTAGAPLRGRFKRQFDTIRTRMNMVKTYIYEFIKVHPEIVEYKRFFIIWKLYTINTNVINLLRYPLKFQYSYKVIERVLKEKFKDEILYKLGLRPKLNLSTHEIILRAFTQKNNPNLRKEGHFGEFIFKKNKKKRLQMLRSELNTQLDKLDPATRLEKLLLIVKFQQEVFMKKQEEKIRKIDPVYYTLAKIAIVAGLSVQEVMTFTDVQKDEIRAENIIYSSYVRSKPLNPLPNPNAGKTPKEQALAKIDNFQKQMLVKQGYSRIKNYGKESYELIYCQNYLEKCLKFNPIIIYDEQPRMITQIIFKFPHNGCRPPKARRLKRSRR